MFLELVSSNSLLDGISRRRLTDDGGNTGMNRPPAAAAQPVWLSEDDLCNMWKIVLKSKLYKTKNGYRMENLAWRLWFYARRRNDTGSLPVRMVERTAHQQHQQEWSTVVREATASASSGIVAVPAKTSINGNSQLPSKSFVVTHEFSLLQLDSDSPVEEEEASPLEPKLLEPAQNMDGLIRRKSSKKKKDVDKFLEQLTWANAEAPPSRMKPKPALLMMTGASETSSSTSTSESNVIKPSPDLRKISVPPRRISRGFSIPSKKSGSSLSNESPKFAPFSSVSSDDALVMFEKDPVVRPNINVPNATYKLRKPSFSRSASPQVSRAPVSMLTILMNGQLTVSDPVLPLPSPPSRPTAPVHTQFRVAEDPIPEESEPPLPEANFYINGKGMVLEDRRVRSRSGKSPSNDATDLQPTLSIW